MISPTNLLHPSPAPHFKNLPGISDLLPEASKFQHHIKLCSKCSTLYNRQIKKNFTSLQR